MDSAAVLKDLNQTETDLRRAAIGVCQEAPEVIDDAVFERLKTLSLDIYDIAHKEREAAVIALGTSSHSQAESFLLELLQAETPEQRGLGAVGLEHQKTEPSVLALIDSLTDPVNTVRNLAERSLLGMSESLQKFGIYALLKLLADPAPLSRSPAARLLGMSEDPRALEPLIQMATEDTEWLARMWATKALGDLGLEAGATAIVDRLHNDEKNRVRAAAASALGTLRPETATDELQKALEDEDAGVKKAVGEALGELGMAGFTDDSDPFDDE